MARPRIHTDDPVRAERLERDRLRKQGVKPPPKKQASGAGTPAREGEPAPVRRKRAPILPVEEMKLVRRKKRKPTRLIQGIRERMQPEPPKPEKPAEPPKPAETATPPPAPPPVDNLEELLHARYLAGALQIVLRRSGCPLDADAERAWLDAHPVGAEVVTTLLALGGASEDFRRWRGAR
jgi:hypothetical protein